MVFLNGNIQSHIKKQQKSQKSVIIQQQFNTQVMWLWVISSFIKMANIMKCSKKTWMQVQNFFSLLS